MAGIVNQPALADLPHPSRGTLAGSIQRVGGTIRIRDNVTIGTLTVAPDGTLHVHTGDAGSVTASVNADDLVVENSATGGISILTPDAVAGRIFFGSPTDNQIAEITAQQSTALMRIGTNLAGGQLAFFIANGVEAGRINAGGQFLGASAGAGSAATPTFSFQGDTNTGIFNNESDLLGFAVAGIQAASFDSSGAFQINNQPSFLAFNSVTDTNVTGNGAAATVDFDTEVFDLNEDFASDTFTAPVLGKYLLSTSIRVAGITAAADDWNLKIVTSNRTYDAFRNHANSLAATEVFQLTVVADMDAADTATVTIEINGEASDVCDIFGAASPNTFFSGALLH